MAWNPDVDRLALQIINRRQVTHRYLAKAVCEKCGGTQFRLEKTINTFLTKDKMIEREIFCHDGFGWELDTFDVICVKCGSKDKVRIDVSNSSTVKQSNRSTQKQEEVVKVGGTKRRKGEATR